MSSPLTCATHAQTICTARLCRESSNWKSKPNILEHCPADSRQPLTKNPYVVCPWAPSSRKKECLEIQLFFQECCQTASTPGARQQLEKLLYTSLMVTHAHHTEVIASRSELLSLHCLRPSHLGAVLPSSPSPGKGGLATFPARRPRPKKPKPARCQNSSLFSTVRQPALREHGNNWKNSCTHH